MLRSHKYNPMGMLSPIFQVQQSYKIDKKLWGIFVSIQNGQIWSNILCPWPFYNYLKKAPKCWKPFFMLLFMILDTCNTSTQSLMQIEDFLPTKINACLIWTWTCFWGAVLKMWDPNNLTPCGFSLMYSAVSSQIKVVKSSGEQCVLIVNVYHGYFDN